MNPVIRIARAPGYTGPLPAYQTEGAAGLDLHAAKPRGLHVGRIVAVPTGIMVEIPPGYEGQIRGRSSLGREGIHTELGTIDSDYRGELSVMLEAGYCSYTVQVGERIAQLVIAPVARCEVLEVEPADLTPTARGAGGFGSTGAR